MDHIVLQRCRSACFSRLERHDVGTIRLLIIETQPDQREQMRQVLELRFGYGSVVCVEGRAEALEQDLETFNLILADLDLTDSTDLELFEELRSRCTTPVIIITEQTTGRLVVEAVRMGAIDCVVKTGDHILTIPVVVEKNLMLANVKAENESLRHELESALRQVKEKNAQLELSLKRVEELAATDPLTGLYNRRHFSRVLERLFAEAQRYGKDLSCVMIDLDGYKQLNDTFGHQFGDQLLVLAGKVMSATMRRMDVAARYGGDEFVLLLPHADGAEAATVAGRIRDGYRHASAIMLRRNDGVSMSVGVASLLATGAANADQLVMLADTALYEAKDAGRNQIRVAGVHEVVGV
jgi:diguanylate cyclase (GGDEF)-like protein